ncbi:Mov34-domain-containing protein [Auriculariales sp. MPI-PUGE-AT-0066]|nr:Mov34-domain-containing protein [Auriculariales sp. MPI-PUGE-AT-0066]
MAIGTASSAIHVQSTAGASVTTSRPPALVAVHSTALFSILDHFLRRADSQECIKTSFPVLHRESDEQVAVDVDNHTQMFETHQKVAAKEVIIFDGLKSQHISALIHNFYTQKTAPRSALHLTMTNGVQDDTPGVKTYITSPAGVFPKPENSLFVPPIADFALLERTLRDVTTMVDRVDASRLAQFSLAVGRYLMDTLGTVSPDAVLDNGRLESLFNAQLHDTLMLSYLGNLVCS